MNAEPDMKDTCGLVVAAIRALLPKDYVKEHPLPAGWGGALEPSAKEADETKALVNGALGTVERKAADAAFEGSGRAAFAGGAAGALRLEAAETRRLREASLGWFDGILKRERLRRGEWGNWVMETVLQFEELDERVAALKADPKTLGGWLGNE